MSYFYYRGVSKAASESFCVSKIAVINHNCFLNS